MNTHWYFSKGEETEGPVTEEQLIALISGRLLTSEHFIVQEGTEEWQTVGASAFAAHVPPAPQPVRVAVHAAAPEPAVAKRRPLGLMLGAACVLVAIGAGAWFLMPRGGSKAHQDQSPAAAGTTSGTHSPTEIPPAPTLQAPIKPPTVPSTGALQYFGKTFAECEKLLGEHTSEERVEQPIAGVARAYKSPAAQASQLRLIQASKTAAPQPFANRVGHLTYSFPKGSIKNWREALVALALPVDDVDETILPDFVILIGFTDGFVANWISPTAEPEANAAANLKEDMMVFMPDPNFKPLPP